MSTYILESVGENLPKIHRIYYDREKALRAAKRLNRPTIRRHTWIDRVPDRSDLPVKKIYENDRR